MTQEKRRVFCDPRAEVVRRQDEGSPSSWEGGCMDILVSMPDRVGDAQNPLPEISPIFRVKRNA